MSGFSGRFARLGGCLQAADTRPECAKREAPEGASRFRFDLSEPMARHRLG